jgi:hypothetical protein
MSRKSARPKHANPADPAATESDEPRQHRSNVFSRDFSAESLLRDDDRRDMTCRSKHQHGCHSTHHTRERSHSTREAFGILLVCSTRVLYSCALLVRSARVLCSCRIRPRLTSASHVLTSSPLSLVLDDDPLASPRPTSSARTAHLLPSLALTTAPSPS